MMKTKKKSLKYCCVCKGIYRGKVIDKKTVSLHRFPQIKRLKRVWIQRCRTVMKAFRWNENKLLCSEHFLDRMGPSMFHTLPSRFPTASGIDKIFPSSALDENDQEADSDHDDANFQDKPFIATRLDVPEHYFTLLTDLGDHQNSDETSFIQEHQLSNLDVSLNFHDYSTEPTPAPSAIRMMETQTYTQMTTTGVQTELVKTFQSLGTQTELNQRDIGEQTNLPTLVYEDVMDHPSKLNFYTGIPNKGIFKALYEEMGDIHGELPIQTRCKRPSGGRPRALRLIDELFMVLMRLRLGLLVDDLAVRFCISSTAAVDC